MSHDAVIIDAENTLMYFQRVLRELSAPMLPRGHVEKLVATLETVLDKHAELAVTFEDEDFEEEDVFLDPDYDDEDEVLDFEPDEDIDFPFEGDGDHSESRGNG